MDIIFVTFNSEKWIEKCFQSLVQSNFCLKNVNVFVVDNFSNDETLVRLKVTKKEMEGKFSKFSIIELDQNLGFGKANNIGAANGKADMILFINIDTEFFEDTLKNLDEEIKSSEPNVAMWEMRQFPYEHPKIYDPVTKEVLWCSGAAFAIKRDVFEQVGGFDERIFMYTEDVDLSWRVQSFGYKLWYCPSVGIVHHTYTSADEVKPNQYVNSIVNNLMLRYRFGKISDIVNWHAYFMRILCLPSRFAGSKKLLFKSFLKSIKNIYYFKDRKKVGNDECFSAKFLGFDYEIIREGAFYKGNLPSESPIVSIIVRTCGRPSVLRETLISLRNQTYKNIEVVVVEDGMDSARKMLLNEFTDLNIKYYATGEKKGRSKVGNIAMEMANGKYLNFLDDDDLFYADHIEVLVYNLETSKCKAAYATAHETPIKILSKEPYSYKIYDYLVVHKQEFDRIVLSHHNYIPIQCIMFEKELFEKYGGLDENIDALEDWDLWVRYSLHTDFRFVNKTTSLYRVPYNKTANAERQKILDNTLDVVREKHKGYKSEMSVYEVAKLYEKANYKN